MGKLDRLVLPPIAVSATGMGGEGEEPRAPHQHTRAYVDPHAHSHAQPQEPRVRLCGAMMHARTNARAQILDIVGDIHLASQFLVELVRGSRVYACTLVPFPYEAL